jgi:hypothetical protein
MRNKKQSPERVLTRNMLLVYALLMLFLAVVVGAELAIERQVAAGYLIRGSVSYWILKELCWFAEGCDALVIAAMVARHTYDALKRLFRRRP